MSSVNVVLPGDVWKDLESGTEALVDGWLVAEGETVSAGQPLANVVVVKANYELLAPAAGVIDRILVPADQTFARGQALAVIRTT
jgi:pyruvate/2-oxoglutarate dehydrogenase complex dihydrolipoamide acyltransferase (E2) component